MPMLGAGGGGGEWRGGRGESWRARTVGVFGGKWGMDSGRMFTRRRRWTAHSPLPGAPTAPDTPPQSPAHVPFSRPSPLCFMPPKGATSETIPVSLTPIWGREVFRADR